MNRGTPTSYLALRVGVDVVTGDGATIGHLHRVVADDRVDIFDGVVIQTHHGPGGLRFVDADQIAELRDDAIVLALSAAEAADLPAPADRGAAGSDDLTRELRDKLHRAWTALAGKP